MYLLRIHKIWRKEVENSKIWVQKKTLHQINRKYLEMHCIERRETDYTETQVKKKKENNNKARHLCTYIVTNCSDAFNVCERALFLKWMPQKYARVCCVQDFTYVCSIHIQSMCWAHIKHDRMKTNVRAILNGKHWKIIPIHIIWTIRWTKWMNTHTKTQTRARGFQFNSNARTIHRQTIAFLFSIVPWKF